MSDELVPYSGFGPDPRFLAQDRKRTIYRSDRVIVELPDIGAGMPLVSMSSHTFSAAYVTGGESLNPAIAVVPNVANVLAFPKGGYTFQFVAPDKLMIFSMGGFEVAAATDMTFLGSTTLFVVGARSPEMPLFQAFETWRISAVSLEVGQVVTKATKGWKIRAQIKRKTGEIEELGSIDTKLLSLAPNSRYDFYAAGGLGTAAVLLAGDVMRLRFEETAPGQLLARPVVTIRRRND